MQKPEVVQTQTIITVRPSRGRVTRWLVKCSDEDHGEFPGEPKNRKAAKGLAMRHNYQEHFGRAGLRFPNG